MVTAMNANTVEQGCVMRLILWLQSWPPDLIYNLCSCRVNFDRIEPEVKPSSLSLLNI